MLLHSLQNVENQFGPGVWPYMKRMVNKQKGKNKAKTLNTCLREGACSTTRIGIVVKICFADSTCNAFWEYNFPELLIGFPRLHQTPHGTVESEAPCDCLQNKSSHQVPESCGHLPTIGIPKAIYHYMTNTTKQQPTYQLFQNIMRPKNQLVNPPKMTKFTSICAFSQFLLQICSYFWPLKLGQWANQSGSRCHMTCKMAGNVPILATRGSRCWHRHARGLGSLLRDAKYG